MLLFPLNRESLFVQIFAFIILWISLQLGFMLIFQNYLAAQFDSNDVINLLNTQSNNEAFRQTIIWGNGLQQIFTFALPAILFGVWSSRNGLKYIGFNKDYSINFNIVWTGGIAVLMVFTMPGIAALINQIPLGDWSDQLQDTRRLMESFYFDDKSVFALFRNLILMAFIPALCEELFFRGVIQRFIYSSTRRLWLSLIFTGVFFSILHSSVVNFLPIVLAAVILGLIYHYTKNLWWSILTHFIYNGIQIVINHFKPASGSNELLTADEVNTMQLVGIGVMAALGGFVIYLILKKMSKIYQERIISVDTSGKWSFDQKNIN